MLFKLTTFLRESSENTTENDDNLEIQTYTDEDGDVSFRFWNGKKYIDVPKNSPQHRSFLQELSQQERIKQIQEENPDFDLDKWKEENEQRINNINVRKASDEIIKDDRKKSGHEDSQLVTVDSSKRKLPKMVKNPTLSELENILSDDFKNEVLMPLLVQEEYYDTNVEFDPLTAFDDDILDDVSYVEHRDIETFVPENKPLVYVYVDRSGSWDTPAKFALSETVVDTFRQFEAKDQAIVKLHYFANNCDSEDNIARASRCTPEELKHKRGSQMTYIDSSGNESRIGGGTNIQPVITNIRNTLNNKKCNVVVVTDADTEYNYIDKPVHVNGSVWYIFVNEWSTTLQNQITGDFQRRFYYTSEEKIV